MISITRSFQFNSLTITDVLEEAMVTLFTLAIQINFHVVIFINCNCNRTVYSNQLYAIVVLQSFDRQSWFPSMCTGIITDLLFGKFDQ